MEIGSTFFMLSNGFGETVISYIIHLIILSGPSGRSEGFGVQIARIRIDNCPFRGY